MRSSFEMKESPKMNDSKYKLTCIFIQCAECGTVVGVIDHNTFFSAYNNTLDIQNAIKQIQNDIKQIQADTYGLKQIKADTYGLKNDIHGLKNDIESLRYRS